MLSQISQSQIDIYCMIPVRVIKIVETKSRIVVVRGWGLGVGKLLFNSYYLIEFQF